MSQGKIYQLLSEKEIDVWNKAQRHECGVQDCWENHRLCSLCDDLIIFGAYQALQPNSGYVWNIDHIIPQSKFNLYYLDALTRGISGPNDINNLQLTHVVCNLKKSDFFNRNYKNGYGKMS